MQHATDGGPAVHDPALVRLEADQYLPALIEVHQTLYGGVGDDSHSMAVPSELQIRSVVERCYEQDAVYENPLLSFSSLPAITDAFLLSRYVSSLCVPGLGLSLSLSPTRWLRGAAELLRSSIGWRKPASLGGAADKDDPHRSRWKVASVWSECGDIAESESFDGFIVGVLDHTLHIQLAPSLALLHGSSSPALGHATDPSEAYARPPPPPSLFHIQLRMLSVFQFNEAGRIVFQRDHWDVRDLVESIVPGAGLAGAVGRWAGGLGLRLVGRVVGGCGPDKGRRPAVARRPRSAGMTTPAETAQLEEKEDHHAAAGVDDGGVSSASVGRSTAYPSSTAPFPASAPMTTFHSTTSTGGTVSPLSPTLQLRQFRGANGGPSHAAGQPSAAAAANVSSNPSSLTSPTLAAALLATTPTRATRQRRGTTSSRSWGSSGARAGSISFPTGPAPTATTAAAAAAAAAAVSGSQNGVGGRPADAHGVLGLDFHPSLAAGLARAAAADDDDSDGRAHDHAP